jgi:UDP-glucose 4-epimerase
VTETVWVTGAKGFIGRHLCRFLAKRGAIVRGVGHGAWDADDAKSWGVQEWIEGDISNVSLNAMLLETGSVPDCIYHLAGGSSVGTALAEPYDDFRRTVLTTANLLEWLRLHAGSTKLIAISSAAVYGADQTGQIPVEAAHTPFSPYGFHKLAMEQLCRAHAQSFELRVCIVRLFSVYGPMLRKQLLWDLCGQLAHSPAVVTLGGTGNELRDWTHIDDIVYLLDIASAQASDTAIILNAGTGVGASVRLIAEQVMRAWGSHAELSFSGVSRSGDPKSLIAKPNYLALSDFTWRTDLAAGLASYVGWYKQYNGITS